MKNHRLVEHLELIFWEFQIVWNVNTVYLLRLQSYSILNITFVKFLKRISWQKMTFDFDCRNREYVWCPVLRDAKACDVPLRCRHTGVELEVGPQIDPWRLIRGEWRLRLGGMYKGLQRLRLLYTNWRSMNLTFLVSRGFFLSNGVRHVCVSCVWVGQWAWR